MTAAAQAPDDRTALQGLKSARVIFDVRVPDQEKLVFNLQLIRETLQGIHQQKVRPVASKGVRFEVCNVAMRLFKVEQAAVIPEAVRVGNVLNSLIGYQNRGYALVTLN
jgi:hypothetical protein